MVDGLTVLTVIQTVSMAQLLLVVLLIFVVWRRSGGPDER